MQSPTQADLVELKRAVRYLLKFPRAVLVFEEQELPRELNGWVDADFAGELVSDDRLQDLCFFLEDIASKRLRRCRNQLGFLLENPSFTLV